MTYKECLNYLFSQLPMYQRQGKAAYKADLNNTTTFLKLINNPEKGFSSIHIAGTNGKGSVSHMLASIFQSSGYKTGLYTSPHLKDFRERIKIDGKKISKKRVMDFVEKNKEITTSLEPSFFEWTVALAFDYFNKAKVDVAIIETGMGGRLDSTNVINPDLSIITNIGYDHTQFLGNTMTLIASEKAGIIKLNTPVVIGESIEETKKVFTEKALKLNAPITFAQDKELSGFECDLKGPYQNKNQQTVLHSLSILKNKYHKILHKTVKKGLKKVVKNTGFRGRWEYISRKPDVLIDMAHNKEGVALAMETINKLKYDRLHIVWGMVNDKDYNSILELLPKNATYYFCKANIPRALDVDVLVGSAQSMGLDGNPYISVAQALKNAKTQAGKKDLIFVGGSTFVVAEVV